MKDLMDLLRKNEKDVCITVVLSGKLKSFDDREKAQVRFRKIMATAKKVVTAEYGEKVAENLVRELNKQFSSLDFGKAREALVVYVAEGFGKSIWLPFREKERLTIRNSFDLQPITDAMNRERDYWVLALSKNKSRLFRGKNDGLSEVVDKNFPVAYKEQFEFEKPRFAMSHKAGTYSPRDLKIDLERQHAFFRHLDRLLKPYFKKDNLQLIVLGVGKNLSEFNKISSFADKVVGTIKGNFDYQSSGQIAEKVWKRARTAVLPQAVL